MSSHQVNYLLQQTQIAVHISGRDVPRRVATCMLMAFICVLAGFEKAAFISVASALLTEGLLCWLNKRVKQSKKPLGAGVGILIFVVNWVLILPFLAFSVILSQSDDLPFVLASYLWMLGLVVHFSNTYGQLYFYGWSQMISAFGASIWMFWNLSQNSAHQAEHQEWLIVATLIIVYTVNTLDTMNRQNDTSKALETIRREASLRLIEVEREARYDALTNLMNRRAFDETAQSLMRQHANKLGLTVFVLDLNDFQPINDCYSHRAGDLVLRTIADRLRNLAGKGGQVARLGADEFAIIKTTITSTEAAQQFGDKVIEAIKTPIPFEQKMLRVGASMGIARQGCDATDLATLMPGAYKAMSLAKQDPDNRPIIFDKEAFPIRANLLDRAILVDAMQNGEIVPYYQPKVSLDTQRIIGFEALSRWQHPERGLLSPAEFLPQINKLGLQREFMLHTARHVLKDIDKLTSAGLDPGQVSINVVETTLKTVSGYDDMRDLLKRYTHLRKHLTFEITEDIFISHAGDMVQRSIANFRREGVRISLDDFGTGFASFQHLKDLEFDELKLDTGFVRDLGINPAAHVLVSGLLTMGAGLNVTVVAEGVETPRQEQMLRDMGYHVVQGLYYGMAASFSDTMQRLKKERHKGKEHRQVIQFSDVAASQPLAAQGGSNGP